MIVLNTVTVFWIQLVGGNLSARPSDSRRTVLHGINSDILLLQILLKFYSDSWKWFQIRKDADCLLLVTD